jgi:hypothetical protein
VSLCLSGYSISTILYRASPLDPFLKAAWWIGRSQDPFTNFYAVFHVSMRQDDDDDDDDNDNDDNDDAEAEKSGW